MPDVTIYTTAWCSFCNAAKSLLDRNKIAYREVDIEEWDDPWQQLNQVTGGVSVPQVVIGNDPIGGYDDLAALHRRGELDQLVAS